MVDELQTDFSGVRVWRGFRSQAYLQKRSDFIGELKKTFIPQTAQQMMPLGLQAYFPALAMEFDAHADFFVPDEVALVVYPSDDAYQRAVYRSVAGRAYGALHSTVFNFSHDIGIPRSKSDAPAPWCAGWQWDQSYSLLNEPVDWHSGSVSVLMAKPLGHLGTLQFYREVDNVVNAWLALPKSEVDAAFLCVSKDWLLYWEHTTTVTDKESGSLDSLMPRICDILQKPNIRASARAVAVPPVFTIDDDGVACREGELLSLFVGETK